MPLLDHFQGLLSTRRSWTAFHGAWATYIAEDLNERLGPGYYAEPLAQFNIEIDVATWEEGGSQLPASVWQPPAPHLTLPFTLVPDIVEVMIYRNEGGPILAGAVELVSPGNKDRPASREAFVSKCATYLYQGAGLVLIDIVTSRSANLHGAMLEQVSGGANENGVGASLFAGAYHPVANEAQTNLEIWFEPLALGQNLPTMPLWLRGGQHLPLDLETTYQRTVQKLKLPVNGTQ